MYACTHTNKTKHTYTLFKFEFTKKLLHRSFLQVLPDTPYQLSPYGKPEYPKKAHDFQQSVDLYSSHIKTGLKSHQEVPTENRTRELRYKKRVV